MLFWHVGGTIWIFRYVFKDPAVDLRALGLGAILPDLLDKPLSLIIAPEAFPADRIYGHTLVFALAILTVGLIVTRRGTTGRRAAVALAVGVLVHLLLDGLWTTPELLFWPAFGTEFPPGEAQSVGELLRLVAASPILLTLEIVGLAYLVLLARRGRLGDPERRRALIRTGKLALD